MPARIVVGALAGIRRSLDRIKDCELTPPGMGADGLVGARWIAEPSKTNIFSPPIVMRLWIMTFLVFFKNTMVFWQYHASTCDGT